MGDRVDLNHLRERLARLGVHLDLEEGGASTPDSGAGAAAGARAGAGAGAAAGDEGARAAKRAAADPGWASFDR